MKGFLVASLIAVFSSLTLAQAQHPLTDAQNKEVGDLKAQAAKLTKQVGQITTTANLQDSDEAVKLLKQVVDELAGIRERLKVIEGAQAGETKQIDKVTKDVDLLKNTKFNGYIQFQYSNTDKIGATQPNAFLIRRARLGVAQTIDPRATLKMSIDFAEGTGRMDTRLKDAILDYNLTPDKGLASKISFGQMPIPLGFDLERSDADREVPERATYNRSLFNGERSRGVVLRANLDKHIEAGLGAMNSLTVDDAEQSGLAPGQGSKIAAIGYIRATGRNYRLGVSGYTGQRPAFTAAALTSPEVDRWFGYVDGEYRMNKFFFRGEAMIGHDRVPSATAGPAKVGNNLSGFQAQAGYNANTHSQFNFRWEQFDPNVSTGGNAVNGYAFAYQYFLSPMAKLQLAHELFTDESRAGIGQRRFFQTTLRMQFRF
jgi:hypothetical protein